MTFIHDTNDHLADLVSQFKIKAMRFSFGPLVVQLSGRGAGAGEPHGRVKSLGRVNVHQHDDINASRMSLP